jgi:hypothetical protein
MLMLVLMLGLCTVTRSWARVESKNKSAVKPSGRFQHSAVYSSACDRMFVFGGQGETNSMLADMWSFDFSTSQWQRLDNSDGGTGISSKKKSSPTARYGQVAISDAHGESMLVLGGCNRHFAHTDYLWQFHFGAQPQPTRAYIISTLQRVCSCVRACLRGGTLQNRTVGSSGRCAERRHAEQCSMRRHGSTMGLPC